VSVQTDGKGVRNFYLLLMSLMALAVRLLPWRYAVLERNIIFGQPDGYYHLRRATIIARNFPHLPGIDWYMAYPYGAEAPWPPLYDYFIGIVSLLFGLGHPSDRTLMLVTTFLPPVTAMLTVVPVYLLARRLGGETTGKIAAFFAVVMPGQVTYSLIGSGDHHTAEVLLLVLYYLFLLKESDTSPGRVWTAKSFPWSGLFLGIAILVWQGSVVFATVSAGSLSLWLLVRSLRGEAVEESGALVRSFSASTAAAILIVSAGRLVFPSETAQTRFDFGFFSWFQPVYLLVLLLAVGSLYGVLYGMERNRERRVISRRVLLLTVAALLAVPVASIPLAPDFWGNILRGVQFILKKNDYLKSINEFQPLFSGSIWPGAVTLRFLLDMLYFGSFFLPPVMAARNAVFAWRRKEGEYPAVFFLLWTVCFWLLTLEQKRWGNAYSANMAIGIGMFFSLLLEKNRSVQSAIRDFREWRREKASDSTGAMAPPAGFLSRIFLYSRKTPWVGSLLLFVVFLAPYYYFVKELYVAPARPITPDIYNSLIWLRENTPPTSTPWNPRTKPEYGVLAEWDLGHWIQYIAERPTVVNNFGYQLRGNGLEDWLRFEFAATEDEAVAICRKRGVRYIFAMDTFYLMETLPKLIGIDFEKEYHSSKPYGHIPMPAEKFYRRVAGRMYYFDGSRTQYGEGLSHFRLVFESKNPSGFPHQPEGTKEVKVYEVVNGARIRGLARPGERVVIACRLVTNFDRQFDYETVAVCDDRGRFEGVVPYSSADNNIAVTPAGPYVAYTESAAGFFQVGNRDVEEGREIFIDLKHQGLPSGRHVRIH